MSAAIVVPLLTAGAVLLSVLRGRNAFGDFVNGAKKGVGVMLHILPSLIGMLSAVAMLRASGLLDAITGWIAPFLEFIGIPPETVPLLLIRPLSGSGALAVGSELIHRYGHSSTVGRTAAVMLGSTETTFYTISVYFGSVDIRNTRYTIPAALCADVTGFVCAALFVRLMK